MAAAANAYQRSDMPHEREDIMDIIFDVSRTDRPFMDNAGTGSTGNVYHEWVTDELDPVDTNNAFTDGEVYDPSVITAPKRMGNHCQISMKMFRITRRAQRTNKVGSNDETARQISRKGQELANDMESILTLNQSSVTDDGTVAPKLGGWPAWITTNVSYGAGGSSGGFSNGNVTAYTPGTTRTAQTEKDLLTLVESTFRSSKEQLSLMMLCPELKTSFTGYMYSNQNARIAGQIQDRGTTVGMSQITVIGAVNAWMTDYGTLEIVPNIFMPTDYVGLINPNYNEVVYFDPISTDAMAKVADTNDRQVLADYTVAVTNEAAHALYADCDPTLEWTAGS